jgi:hypothetical protein
VGRDTQEQVNAAMSAEILPTTARQIALVLRREVEALRGELAELRRELVAAQQKEGG